MLPTTRGMIREVLGTIVDNCMKMAEAAMGMNVADVKARFDVLERSMKILDVIERNMLKMEVVHCADCEHCMSPERVEHMRPYHKAANAFYCKKWDMDFFAPNYRAETWFCADGIPRVEGEDGMK